MCVEGESPCETKNFQPQGVTQLTVDLSSSGMAWGSSTFLWSRENCMATIQRTTWACAHFSCKVRSSSSSWFVT